MWIQFQEYLFRGLKELAVLTGDWGVAIILLTILIRVVLLPLTIKQTKSMYELQRIQPKLKELQDRYKDDKEKQQEELMKFYAENKVNPLGGCLPILLQMPVFFALFRVIGGTPQKPGIMLRYLESSDAVLKAKDFIGVIPDITITPHAVWAAHDYVQLIAYVLLVLIFGVSIWLPQALMPGDKQQKTISAYMAIMMLYFGWVSPAGVLLYWDVSSIWGIVQQQLTIRWMKRQDAHEAPVEPTTVAAPAVAAKKPANKKSKKK